LWPFGAKTAQIEIHLRIKISHVSDCRADFVFWIEKFSPALGDALLAMVEANQPK
jgi:hypothetical protein